MANPEHQQILSAGVAEWNRWRTAAGDLRPDLSETSLSRRDLRGANFTRCSLAQTHLNHSDVSGADFTRANLSGCSFNQAHAGSAVFQEAILDGANFSAADLTQADLSYASLIGAHLTDTNLEAAQLSGADLSKANLYQANLKNAVLRSCRLRWANLTGAVLTNARLRGSDLTGASFLTADLSGADLCGANLQYARVIESKVEGADFTGCRVYGISAWCVEAAGAKESDLVITPPDEPAITVDNLEVAQFVYLLLSSAKVRQTIDTITAKLVLILGRFTPERLAVLQSIREALRNRGYLPMLFDFEGPRSRDVTETVSTLAHLARFVIADITDARSIPQELMAIVPNLPSVPVQPLLQANQMEYGIFEHFRRYPWVLEIVPYENGEALAGMLERSVIGPAEAMANARARP